MASKEKPTAIKRKGVTKSFIFTGLDNKEYTINEKQRLFCESYINPFTTGVQAVVDAGYNVHSKKNRILNQNMAKVIASQNLTKLNICAYLTVLLDDSDLNDQGVDKQMHYVISQFKDLNAKNRAISEYNKIKGRLAPEEIKHTVTSVNVINYSKKKKKKDDSNKPST